MLGKMEYLDPYGQYWFVTITPYGKDIEPMLSFDPKIQEENAKIIKETQED